MTDRFKFRVWSKPDEPTKTEGYYVDDADYMVMTPDGKVQIEYYCDNGYDGYIDSFEQDEVIVEFCTGLKDKNGKLVYENDYVKYNENVYKVFWNKTKISLENILNNDIIGIEELDYMEIIGNEHEKGNIGKI